MQEDMRFFSVHDRPALRFYGFDSDCITAGYSQDIASEIDLKKAQMSGIDVAKRPTGGGIVLHSSADIAFCCVLPSKIFPEGFMSAYHFVSDIILCALRHTGVMAEKKLCATAGSGDCGNLCFSGAKEYEITLGGKKLVGIAQKRTREKILQQGAISIARPRKDMVSVIRNKCSSRRYLEFPAILEDVHGMDWARDEFLRFAGKSFNRKFEKPAFSVL